MTEIKFTDTATLSGTRITDAGYLVADVRCARTGCQAYHASEMGLVGDHMVNVYRSDAVVFDKASMATFAGKPVTINHPVEPVTADNWKNVAVGDILDEVARDGETIRVSIKLMDAAAIKAVQDGTREISMGYSTGVQMQDGVAPDGTEYQAVQTGPIKINHLAIVAKGRAGQECRIGDADNWGASPVPLADMKGNNMSMQTVVLGDEAAQVAVADAPKVEKFKTDAAKTVSDMETAHTTALTAKDEEIGTLKADNKALKDAAITPAKMTSLIADRVALETVVKAIDAKIEVADVSDADLRKAAVASKLGDEMVADASEAEIVGMFKAIAKDAAKADPFADAMKGGVKTTLHAADAEAKAHAAYIDGLNPEKKDAA